MFLESRFSKTWLLRIGFFILFGACSYHFSYSSLLQAATISVTISLLQPATTSSISMTITFFQATTTSSTIPNDR